MIVKRVTVEAVCGVCGRTMLLGERAVRFAVYDGESRDVCALCTDQAVGSGWVREGSSAGPLIGESRPRKRRLGGISSLIDGRRDRPEPVLDEPVLRRLTDVEQAMIQAAELYNASPYRRTVEGLSKSLGDPRVSFLLLSGTNTEVVLTIAWELSWYQYRIVVGGQQSVRLAERGYEIDDLDPRFQQWNGTLEAGGRVAPDIPRF